jgi:hypothetical protein
MRVEREECADVRISLERPVEVLDQRGALRRSKEKGACVGRGRCERAGV